MKSKKINQMIIQKNNGITECWVSNKDYRELEKKYNELLENNNKNKIEFEINEYGRRTFTHNGIEHVEFKENTFVAKTILSKEIIDDIVEDKRCLDSEKDVRYNNDIFNNKWEDSYIRKILNEKFKNKYLGDLEIDGEVRCLTKEEVEYLPEELRETDRFGYWTMSPSYYGNANVFAVSSAGCLDNWSVNITNGVRPVIKLKTEEL